MKRKLAMLLTLLLITSLAACDTAKNPYEGANSMQLIPDAQFSTGFVVKSQKDHKNKDKVVDLGVFPYDKDKASARWSIAQWDSGPCLWENRKTDVPDNVLTNGTDKKVEIKKGQVSLYLDSSGYYQGNPAIQGDYWPHLLIEQGSFSYNKLSNEQKVFYHADSEAMVLEFDIRLTEYEKTEIKGDWVRAAQLLMYFYVRSGKGDFLWFGLQLFDNRSDNTEHYIGYDGGKADASGAMIYSIGSRHVYKNSKRTLWKNRSPYPSDEWIHVKIDILPYIEDAFNKGKEDGYFKAEEICELYIDGMNYGFETIGTFKHSADIKNLSLTSYRYD